MRCPSGVIGAGEFTEVAEKLVKRMGLQSLVAQTVMRELLENAAQIRAGLPTRSQPGDLEGRHVRGAREATRHRLDGAGAPPR